MLEALASAGLGNRAIFRPAAVQTAGARASGGTRDHAHKLWQLLMFQLWAQSGYLVGRPGP